MLHIFFKHVVNPWFPNPKFGISLISWCWFPLVPLHIVGDLEDSFLSVQLETGSRIVLFRVMLEIGVGIGMCLYGISES